MSKGNTKTIEVFRPGSFRCMQGEVLNFTADMLRGIVAVYDPAVAPAPAVVGHPKTDDPAYGWAAAFSYDDTANRMLADLDELEPQFADAVAAGRYKRISMSFYSPGAPGNPKPGSWYPKHIGFLGAAAPAVPGLRPVSFATDTTGVVEFVSGETAASMFRQLREFFIEKFGMDDADKVLPSWQIEWLNEQEAKEAEPLSSFSTPPMENPMPNPNAAAQAGHETDLAAREADLARREAEAVAREQRAIHDANVSFAEALISEGRVLPVQRDRLVGALDAIDTGAATVSFADGNAQSASGVLRSILKELPKVVPLGMSPNATPERVVTDFALPPGATAEADDLELLAKAEAYMREHKVELNEAVKAVSR